MGLGGKADSTPPNDVEINSNPSTTDVQMANEIHGYSSTPASAKVQGMDVVHG